MQKSDNFSLAIHGGIGLIAERAEYEKTVTSVLMQGREALLNGSSALDTVELCVRLLEDSPLFNAGRGSVLNEKGGVELDASIMDGRNLSAGAVAAVSNVKNPVSLARKVMENSEHVFLIGSGAMEFARKEGVETVEQDYFFTKPRQEQLENAKKASNAKKLGTVGAVAYDTEGNLAAATSTGGVVNKQFGRVGDSPIIGAGVFADNETCAVSCTGVGEHFLRTNLAKMIADFMLMNNLDIRTAAKKSIEYFSAKVNGVGGFIAIGKDGIITHEFTTPQMVVGFTDQNTEPTVSI